MSNHNGGQNNWEINAYGKEQQSKRTNQMLENHEFEIYNVYTCQGPITTLLQPSRLLIFKDGIQIPLAIKLPGYMNDPRSFLSETYYSGITVLGNNTEVKIDNEIIKAHSEFKPRATAQSSSLEKERPYCLVPFSKTRTAEANFPIISSLVPTSCIRNNGIQISIVLNEEHGRYYDGRGVMNGLICLKKFVESNGIQTNEIWDNIIKGIEGKRFKIQVKLSCRTNQGMLAIEESENQLMTLSIANWKSYENDGSCAKLDMYTQTAPVGDKRGPTTAYYVDSEPAIYPGCRITNIFADYFIVGDGSQAHLPKPNYRLSNDVNFTAMSVFTTQRIRHMLWYNDILVIPNVLIPTGLISKSNHKALIKYCNDLRKIGNSDQLEAILSNSFIQYSYSVDAQLSFGLSKAFALIHKDIEGAEKYLNSLLDVVWKSNNVMLFLGRIYLYKGYINLLRKHCEIALDELDKATYYLQNFQAGEIKAWLCYLKGVLYKISAEESQMQNTYWEQKSLKYFDLYLQHVKIEEKDGFFAHKGVNFVMLKMATMHLMICEKMEYKHFKMASGALNDAKGCLKLIKSSRLDSGRGSNAEYNSIKADIALKEVSLSDERDVLNASVSHFKNNPTSFIQAEKELQSKVLELENGKQEQM